MCDVTGFLAGGGGDGPPRVGVVYACVRNPLYLMISCMVSSSSMYSLCCRW